MDLHLVILSAGAALEVVSSDRRQLLFMVLLFLAFPDLFLSFPAAVLGTKAGGMWHTCPSHSSPVGLLLPRCTSLPSTCSSSFEMVLGQKIVKGFFYWIGLMLALYASNPPPFSSGLGTNNGDRAYLLIVSSLFTCAAVMTNAQFMQQIKTRTCIP